MIFEKYRNRISFNVLSLLGWMSFIYFCTPRSEELICFYEVFIKQGILGFPFGLICVFIMIRSSIIFLIYLISKLADKKPLNFAFLKNKIFLKFQIIGAMFVIIPFVIFVPLFLYTITELTIEFIADKIYWFGINKL